MLHQGNTDNDPGRLETDEDIQVGDWVLSSLEDGSGEPEFKRVVRTFVFKDKTIRRISFFDSDRRRIMIGATDNHPFWVEGVGWTRADVGRTKRADGGWSGVGGSTKRRGLAQGLRWILKFKTV
jgi:hypothetical protein